jgi:hypothetical protein
MAVDPPINKVTAFVPACVEKLTNGNVCAFARLVEVHKTTVHGWCYNSRGVPRLDLLFRVCYRLGASLSDLLTKDSVSLNHDLINHSLSRMPVTRLRRKNGEIRRAFLTALKCGPAPSIHEFSESLGYKNPDFLYLKYSDLCKKITARYHKSRRYLERIQPSHRIRIDDETIKDALQSALNEPVTPSLHEIRKRLGYYKYVGRYVLQRRFPELCQAIVERRAAQQVKYQKHLRRKLKSILGEEPAPTLTEVGKRLGFRGNNYLLEHHPDLCRAIVRRHSEYRKAQFNGIPDKLRAILREEPPVPLRAAATRLGRNPAYLGSRFPDVCQAISKRYLLFKRKRSLENKKEVRGHQVPTEPVLLGRNRTPMSLLYPLKDEIAFEETDKTVSILRFFSPANLDPDKICYSAPYGMQHEDRYQYLLVEAGKIVGFESGLTDKASTYWNFSNEDMNTWAPELRILSTLLKKDRLTDFQTAVLDALIVHSRSLMAKQISDRLIYLLVALESIFLKDTAEVIGEALSLRMAYMRDVSVPERRQIIENVKKAYKLRSLFIHHGKRISVEDKQVLKEFMINAWLSLAALIPLAASEVTKKEFFDNLENRRLAG